MPIVKYRLEDRNGIGYVPDGVDDGGYWSSPIDNTMLGWSDPPSQGERYKPTGNPDNLVVMTKTDVVDRQLEIHASYPMANTENTQITLTESEVTTLMENWVDTMWNEKMSVHTGYVPENDEVNSERERRIYLGCNVAIANVGTIYVTGRPQDIRNMAGLGQGAIARLLLGDANTVVPYRDGYDNVYDLTPPQMLELWQKSAGYVSQIYQASWQLKANTIPVDYKANSAYWPTSEL